MEWLFGFAFVPALLCGVMCTGGAVLGAIAVRRAAKRPSAGSAAVDDDAAGAADPQRVTVGR